jgi:hypothetical protein
VTLACAETTLPIPVPVLRLGSLTARLDATPSLGGDIAYIFGTSLKAPTSDLLMRVDADIVVRESEGDDPSAADPSAVAVPPDGMVVRQGHPVSVIHTEALSVTIDHARSPVEVRVRVRPGERSHYDLCVHLAVVFHKILFLLGRVVLHAAAVRLAGRVAIFIGDRGAGKTTTSLALTRAGGTVLGEDHIIVRRSADGFLVSGCDERWRVDARTERHFFDSPLPLEAADYAGRMKKEVAVRDVASQPFTDEPPAQLFFMRAGSRFEITPIPRAASALRLMEAAGKLQRFVDAHDRFRFLTMISDFVGAVTPYTLERSDDLGDLDHLIDFLRRDAAERVTA